MVQLNHNFQNLKDSYLFYNISQRTAAYQAAHPGQPIYRLGIGDVSQPLCPAVIEALHRAVDDQAHKASFRGYQPECGTAFLREAIARHYGSRGVSLQADEIFITSGAGDELGNLLGLFGPDNRVMVLEPAYPAYVDTNIMAGHPILRRSAGQENGFLPLPDGQTAELIYLCSPNNPTGAAYTRAQLQQWVDFANEIGAVILFDAAYEAFIQDADVPHSIYELPGAQECAIEICSLSKTAGFTGTRCGYTVVPRALVRDGQQLHPMWVRDRTTKTNGVSYILQRGAAAVFTPEGQRQTQAALSVYRENARVLAEALDRLGIWYCGGRNAPYLWLRCPDGLDSWAFFDRLLERAQIVGVPGAGFGACGEGFFRFSAFGDPAEIKAAAARLERKVTVDS